jgi:2-phospho-L-lactate guanylyltransferase
MRALLVPVKSFTTAKRRLAPALDPAGRQALARHLAARVLSAADGLPTFVACDDPDVARWAEMHGASVLWTPGLGLSGAVADGVARLEARGFGYAVVCHADLPLVASLAGFGLQTVETSRPPALADSVSSTADTAGRAHLAHITLAPDRRLDGTNVACVPTDARFVFSYGPGSFARHVAESRRLGIEPTVVHDWRLASDVDLPADLALLR